jgi:hypothetical protein
MRASFSQKYKKWFCCLSVVIMVKHVYQYHMCVLSCALPVAKMKQNNTTKVHPIVDMCIPIMGVVSKENLPYHIYASRYHAHPNNYSKQGTKIIFLFLLFVYEV